MTVYIGNSNFRCCDRSEIGLYINVTDRQADGWTTYHDNTALCVELRDNFYNFYNFIQ